MADREGAQMQPNVGTPSRHIEPLSQLCPFPGSRQAPAHSHFGQSCYKQRQSSMQLSNDGDTGTVPGDEPAAVRQEPHGGERFLVLAPRGEFVLLPPCLPLFEPVAPLLGSHVKPPGPRSASSHLEDIGACFEAPVRGCKRSLETGA